MLDNETKRRIDTARDILVGKVPDPKSQVEQITIALVYKFMDDMDKESIELGGKPSFFTGDYERYAWSKIFDPRIGGHEMLSLYSEAIVKLNQNPNLPQLFRDIFKNAYLPYRDPETLKLFLKTINEFTYDHSERLGDAFEYLLSVLGSQGDAGQFRTPRHIIDFMVQIVNPQKHETVLDPACGTAGFLISSYKHILKENSKKTPGDLLTPEERKKLLTNFKGYDISPDMVRLSLVNMYLHGFVQPQIVEYDTLTSEDRWNEYADVILANPPFMTPKGGIKPHKRFSVQSNRSEVLFVDYIAEHLTPTGRAAVIVPEGIIFQSANAYKTLRKMLVENCLYAVVSLPAGVFNPYSGVKTSILLMDKQLAKKTDSILFVKIENDGFDLGAQRRQIDKNDLPDALNVIREYITAIRNGKPETFIIDEKPCGALLVKKEKLAENGEYNLTGDRYRIVETRRHQKWPMVELGEVCEFISGFAFKSENLIKNPTDNEYLPVIKIGSFENKGKILPELEYHKYTNDFEKYLVKKGDILIAMTGATVGKTAVSQFDNCLLNQRVGLVRNKDKIIHEYLREILFSNSFYQYCQQIAGGGAQGNISPSLIQNFLIPLPPIEVQREIVAEIEGYQKLIDGCRQVIDTWKPDIEGYLDEDLKLYLEQHPEKKEELKDGWPMVRLGEVCTFVRGPFGGSLKKEIFVQSGYAIYEQYHAIYEDFTNFRYFIDEDKFIEMKRFEVKTNDIIMSCSGTMGKTAIVPEQAKKGIINQALLKLTPQKELYSVFLKIYMDSREFQIKLLGNVGGAAIQNVASVKVLQEIPIPLPPLEIQQRIVAKIEAERKVIDGCRELIKTYEAKIKRVIDKAWEG